MTKTPEELTEKWKTRILPSGWYYIKIEGFKGVDIDLYDKEGNSWLCNSDKDLNPLNVIAPVPTYDEYKAMQAELAEHRKNCCCLENEKLWPDKAKLEEENNKLRELMKGCKLSTFKIYDRLRFSDENEITPADLINTVDEIRPMLSGILNSINAALGDNEIQANPVDNIKIQESEE